MKTEFQIIMGSEYAKYCPGSQTLCVLARKGRFQASSHRIPFSELPADVFQLDHVAIMDHPVLDALKSEASTEVEQAIKDAISEISASMEGEDHD